MNRPKPLASKPKAGKRESRYTTRSGWRVRTEEMRSTEYPNWAVLTTIRKGGKEATFTAVSDGEIARMDHVGHGIPEDAPRSLRDEMFRAGISGMAKHLRANSTGVLMKGADPDTAKFLVNRMGWKRHSARVGGSLVWVQKDLKVRKS